MSRELETKNLGRVGNFGFWGPDTTRVMLGELPAIPTARFCIWSTQTMVSLLSLLKGEERERLADAIKDGIDRVREDSSGGKIRPTRSVFDLPVSRVVEAGETIRMGEDLSVQRVGVSRDFIEDIGRVLDSGDFDGFNQLMDGYFLALGGLGGKEMGNYLENPFVIEGSGVTIAGKYSLDCEEFAWFAIGCIGGGTFGWDSRGTPDYAQESLNILARALVRFGL